MSVSFSPPPAWYEPRWTSYEDWEPDDENEVAQPTEDLSVVDGIVLWSAAPIDTDAED